LGHVLDLLYLTGEIVDHFLDVLELACQFCAFLTGGSQLFDEICILLGGSLYFFISSFDGAICLAIDIFDLSIDVTDMSLNFIDSAEGVVVAFVF